MAATVKGTSGLVFGTPTESSVIMQSVEETRSTEVVEARDEDGDVTGLAFYGGNRTEVTGEYLFKGSDIGALGASITLTGLTTSGDLYITELGTKTENTGFKKGSFKAVAVTGITG